MDKTLDPSEIYKLHCMYGCQHTLEDLLNCHILKYKFFDCAAMGIHPDLKTIGKLMYE